MASDLLSDAGLTITDVGDQASLEDDLRANLFSIRRVLRHPMIKRILVDLHPEIDRNPMLEQAIRPFQRARRARIDALIERGEVLPSVDRETAADRSSALLAVGGNRRTIGPCTC